ncbi:Eukaryotic initiation factor 4E family protein [Tritrichomonas foetus]|uniref:Eukaryotic initiation factor 4E family protein n=1 Tax=Tritrichomonas foetus TaxID=1144522 RepID=A0A1J4JX28_9EUKA|nr:Eukaryotic initiation factor 4E family protein [Tritrichomonas foetus]|eukprot:OHT03016.1 Eukaryotic initiation factor 4E family protein [Tritrichomonas foetus]
MAATPQTTDVIEHVLKGKAVPEFHQLNSNWTFYYLIPNRLNAERTVNWKTYLKILHDFNTFEDFWAIVDSIEPPSRLQKGCRYYIFKKGIEPLWEDPKNNGGKEISIEYRLPSFTNNKDKRGKNNHEQIEKIQQQKEIMKKCQDKWIDLCMAVFCNHPNYFKATDKINGIEYNCRAGIIKVGIWTKQIDEKDFTSIKDDLHRVMEYVEGSKECYPKESEITLDRVTP